MKPYNSDAFAIQIDDNSIALIQLSDDIVNIDSLNKLKAFSDLLLDLAQQDYIKAIVYDVPLVDSAQIYASLIRMNSVSQELDLFHSIYANIDLILRIEKPVIALITKSCHNLSLTTALWAKHRVSLSSASLVFEDTKYGLFAGFGVNSVFSRIANIDRSLSFLLKQGKINTSEAQKIGLIEYVADDYQSLVLQAKSLILDGCDEVFFENDVTIDEAQIEETNTYIKKFSNKLPKGILFSFENIQHALAHELSDSLLNEKNLYHRLWSEPETVDYLRVQYFGAKDAVNKAKKIVLPHYKLRRLGIIGAGMMGAGIAFEAAKADVSVILKDSSIERAEHGKAYSLQVSDKLIQQGRMTVEKQEKLLNSIHPTADIVDFENMDLIIEAVNEDKTLKAIVSKESVNYLLEDGIFASNTTSIPISDLAKAITDPGKFIGMHFFSPVDRMALLEIIKGEFTSEETLQKALYVASKLGKIPIVVNDGPAFFTSRIFFNYLLEAIIMVMEGIPPQWIEEQAKIAGFGASPLAVLDEISLPLMLQVYDQLPEMHEGQRRVHRFLSIMVAEGRLGRKSNAGFYTYSTEGKEIYLNPAISEMKSVELIQIQKRLLHVVALDSYRCLEAGILERPIDADLGSILGLGYPAITGGVFGHIDRVGIQQFVQDCKTFQVLGEQWHLSAKLIDLASKNFRFYSGLVSNWK